MLKVILDTNIIVSGLFWRGSPHKVLEMARRREILAFCSQEMIVELHDVLVRKLKISRSDANILVDSVTAFMQPIKSVRPIRVVADDPDDDKFVACAAAASADYIVSGDSHLLAIERYKKIRILRARDFLCLVPRLS